MPRRQDAPVTLSPDKWANLNEAFHQARARLGSDQPTEHDLMRDLRNGDLIGATREILRDQETVTIRPKAFWKDHRVVASRFYGGVTLDPLPPRGTYVFIRRDGLDKRYPRETVVAPHRSDDMRPPPRRRGPPPDIERWWGICAEIARRCIDPKTGRVKVTENETKLADDVLAWLAENEQGSPSVSQMRAAVKYICAALRKVQR